VCRRTKGCGGKGVKKWKTNRNGGKAYLGDGSVVPTNTVKNSAGGTFHYTGRTGSRYHVLVTITTIITDSRNHR
jgi:hypothetical protein